MKFQKILALCLANLALFSSVAFANPPGKEKQEEFENYFQTECEEAKKVKDKEGDKWYDNIDKRADIFDKVNQENYTNVLKKQELYANRQNTYHDCNCRFVSADLSKKLTSLGFENYELLAVTDFANGEYHLANLYKDCNGNWAVADLFNGVNYLTKQTYKESAHIDIFAYLQGLACQKIFTIYIKNKPLVEFKEEVDQGLVNIRLFSAIYEELLGDKPIQIPTSISNCIYLFFLKSKTRTADPIESFKIKLTQMNKNYNLNLSNDQIEQYISKYQQNEKFKSLFMSYDEANKKMYDYIQQLLKNFKK